MLHVLKSLAKGVSALMLIAGLAVRFVPATEAEAAALGPDHSRSDLMLKRMAWTAMTAAPELTVQSYAQMIGLPPDRVRAFLEAAAEGRPLASAEAALADAPSDAGVQTGRRIDAGGALFVKVD